MFQAAMHRCLSPGTASTRCLFRRSFSRRWRAAHLNRLPPSTGVNFQTGSRIISSGFSTSSQRSEYIVDSNIRQRLDERTVGNVEDLDPRLFDEHLFHLFCNADGKVPLSRLQRALKNAGLWKNDPRLVESMGKMTR